MVEGFVSLMDNIFVQHWELFRWLFLIIYVIGVLIEFNVRRQYDYKFYEGGFLGAGYTTSSTRPAIPKDIWIACIWPIFFLLAVIRACVWLLHESISLLLLVIGIRYNMSDTYKKINHWL